MLDAKTLSLADLEAFDPQAPDRGRNRRFLCPLAGCDGHPQTASHRNLSANVDDGTWNCKRCGEKGLLVEFREKRPKVNPRERGRAELRRLAEYQPVPTSAPLVVDPEETWRKKLQQPGYLLPLEGTPGEGYLSARGIPVGLARAARVRYCPRWEHWKQAEGKWTLEGASRRVVFPIYADDCKTLAAVQGRSISEADDFTAAKLSRGEVNRGVFATPGAWDAEAVVVVEAPIDALSLAACGLPAVATMGCELPGWLARALAFRCVLIGTDADKGGDTAAEKWYPELRRRGAIGLQRLRPEGAKDWNEWLTRDPEGMRAYLAPYLPGSNVRPADIADQAEAGENVTGCDVLDDQPAADLGPLFTSTMQEACNLLGGAPLEMWETLAPCEAEMNEALAAGDLARLSVACGAYLDAARALAAKGIPDPFEDEDVPAFSSSLFDLAPSEEPAGYGGLQGS